MNRLTRIRNVILLCVSLVVLLSLAVVLTLHAPAVNLCKGATCAHFGHPPRVWLENAEQRQDGTGISEIVIIDLDTGRYIRPRLTHPFTYLVGVDRSENRLESLQLEKFDPSTNSPSDLRWQLLDADTLRVLHSEDFSIPLSRGFYFTNDRALFTAIDDKLYFVDFDAGQPIEARPIPLETRDFLDVVPGTRIIHRASNITSTAVTQNGTATPIQYQHELFEIDSGAALRKIANWDSGPIGSWPYHDYSTQIVTIDKDCEQIETRSGLSGELLSTQPVPEGFDPKTMAFRIFGRLIRLDDGRSNPVFDMKDRRWLYKAWANDASERYLYFRSHRLDEGLVLWKSGRRDYIVVDENAKAELCSIQTPYEGNRVARFIDSQRIAIASTRFGGSMNVFDVFTGRLLDSHRPFSWIAWSMPSVLVGYVIWIGFFLVHRSRGHGFAWIDIAIMFALPLTVLTTRLLLRGLPEDTARLPYSYVRGISMAALAIATVWIVWGRTAWTLRILPLGIIIALIVTMIVISSQHQPTLVWHATVSILLPPTLAILLLGAMRLSGLKLVRLEGASSCEPIQAASRTQWPIRDLFLITAVISLVFAAFRPAIPEIGELLNVRYLQWSLLAQVAILSTIPLMALSDRKIVFGPTLLVIVILLAWLIAEVTLQFIGLGMIEDWLTLSGVARIQIMFAVALFVGLQPYRLRGWRIIRGTEEEHPANSGRPQFGPG